MEIYQAADPVGRVTDFRQTKLKKPLKTIGPEVFDNRYIYYSFSDLMSCLNDVNYKHLPIDLIPGEKKYIIANSILKETSRLLGTNIILCCFQAAESFHFLFLDVRQTCLIFFFLFQ